MDAMIEAGLVSNGDLNIVDVTPEDASLTDAIEQNGVASALGIAGFIISIISLISLIGVGVLYFLCWKKGLFMIEKTKRNKAESFFVLFLK